MGTLVEWNLKLILHLIYRNEIAEVHFGQQFEKLYRIIYINSKCVDDYRHADVPA